MERTTGVFDDLARLMTGAMGVAQGVQEEAKTFMRAQADRVVSDLDLVSREDLDAVKDLAARAQTEADALRGRVAALEAALEALQKGR